MPNESAAAPASAAVTPSLAASLNAPVEEKKPETPVDPAVARDLALENASKADRDARRRMKEADKAKAEADERTKNADKLLADRLAPLDQAIQAREKGDLATAIREFLGKDKFTAETAGKVIYAMTDLLPEDGDEVREPEEPFEDRVSKVVEAREAKREAERVAAEKLEQEAEQAEARTMLEKHIGEARDYLKGNRDAFPLLKKWSKDPEYDIEADYRRKMVSFIDEHKRAPKAEEVFQRMEADRKAKGSYYEPEKPAEAKKSWRDELAGMDEEAERTAWLGRQGEAAEIVERKETAAERERRKLQEMEAEERNRSPLTYRRGA